jgi:hypothetical protein
VANNRNGKLGSGLHRSRCSWSFSVKQDETGTLTFGAIEAEIDCRIERFADRERLSFSFAGFDEGDEVSGRGWAVVDENSMNGWFSFHLGDESTFKAERKRSK